MHTVHIKLLVSLKETLPKNLSSFFFKKAAFVQTDPPKQLRFYSHKFSSVIKNCSEAFTRWDNVHTLKLVIRVLQYNNNNNEVESFIEKAFYFLIIQNALPLRLLSRLLSQ